MFIFKYYGSIFMKANSWDKAYSTAVIKVKEESQLCDLLKNKCGFSNMYWDMQGVTRAQLFDILI